MEKTINQQAENNKRIYGLNVMMQYIKAKTILSNRNKNIGFSGADYNMNLYRGCNHGCIYCDSRSECYQIEDFDRVRVKEKALSILEDELIRKRVKGTISFGAMNDPYNGVENNEKLTRDALKLINKYQYGVSILTKSDLVVRDIDIFKQISLNASCAVRMTITTFDDELCKIIEPNVSISSKRFKALKKIAENDIIAGIHAWPILAFINDDPQNIINIIRKAAECGVKFVYPYFGVTLRQNQRVYFYDKLDRYFPSIKKKYEKYFGNSYECISPNADKLKRVFIKECNKNNILYRTKDVIDIIQSSAKQNQMQFF